MKKMITIRLSEYDIDRLEELSKLYKLNKTEIIEKGINIMWCLKKMNEVEEIIE